MKLSVAAVTAASASASATATSTPSAVTSAPATASAVATASAATTSSAFALRTCFVDDERAAEKLPSVESCDDLFGFGVIPNFGETETARLAREPIAEKRKRIRLHARFRK